MPDCTYDTALDSQTTEQFLKDVPESVWDYVRFVIYLKLIHNLDGKGLKVWDRMVETFPVLQRIIVYTYCPLEAFDMRLALLRLWDQADNERGDFKNPQVLYDATIAWSISKHPEVSKYPGLVAFLEQLGREFSCVLQADLRKNAGHPDTLGELRKNWKMVDKQGSRTIIKIDQSPFNRINHIIFDEPSGLSRIEIHYYLLDDPTTVELEQFFTDTDAYLTEWMQMFDGFEEVKNTAYSQDVMVYVYGRGDKLIRPPGRHENPFPFDLMTKYKVLLKNIYNKYNFEPKAHWEKKNPSAKGTWLDKFPDIERDKIDRTWDLKESFKKTIHDWNGTVPPAAYFCKTLKNRFKDSDGVKFTDRFIKRSEVWPEEGPTTDDGWILKDNLDFSGGSIHNKEGELIIDPPYDPNKHIDCWIDIQRFYDNLEHPIDREIISDYIDVSKHSSPNDSRRNMVKPASDVELSEILSDQDFDFTPQYIGQRRKKVGKKFYIFLKEHDRTQKTPKDRENDCTSLSRQLPTQKPD